MTEVSGKPVNRFEVVLRGDGFELVRIMATRRAAGGEFIVNAACDMMVDLKTALEVMETLVSAFKRGVDSGEVEVQAIVMAAGAEGYDVQRN
jgi:hypothetical protein